MAVLFLVGERGGLEGFVEIIVWDFVVVVEELVRFGERVAVIDVWSELVGMLSRIISIGYVQLPQDVDLAIRKRRRMEGTNPSQIYIQSRHHDALW